MLKNEYILFFNEINQGDLSQVGGKGANLGEMRQAGFPVPDGFCVTTGSYRAFLGHNHLEGFISQVLQDANLENISQAGAQIRERLTQAEIPAPVVREVLQALEKASPQECYAVRSSATAEDMAFASLAGQQDTYLNIQGKDPILEAVRSCWASLFTGCLLPELLGVVWSCPT